MPGVWLLLVLGIELVVQIYEIVVEIVIQIVVVVLEVVVVQVFIVEVFIVPLLALDIVFVVILQIVLEILVLRIRIWCPLRQPRFRPPGTADREALRGPQHGAHYRNLLVVRPKRARASPRVTTSYDRSR